MMLLQEPAHKLTQTAMHPLMDSGKIQFTNRSVKENSHTAEPKTLKEILEKMGLVKTDPK